MKHENLNDVHAQFVRILDRSIDDPNVHGLCRASFSSGAVAVVRELLVIVQIDDIEQRQQRLEEMIRQVSTIAATTQQLHDSLVHPARGVH